MKTRSTNAALSVALFDAWLTAFFILGDTPTSICPRPPKQPRHELSGKVQEL